MLKIEKTVFITYRRTNIFHALAIFKHRPTNPPSPKINCLRINILNALINMVWQDVIMMRYGIVHRESISIHKMPLPITTVGNAYTAKKSYDLAIKDYKRALQINPNLKIARENLARAERKKARE